MNAVRIPVAAKSILAQPMQGPIAQPMEITVIYMETTTTLATSGARLTRVHVFLPMANWVLLSAARFNLRLVIL